MSTGTFKNDSDLGTGESDLDPLDVETQRLVLEAGPGGAVTLRRKQYGARSQLWRMTGDGQLQHEGNTARQIKSSVRILILEFKLHLCLITLINDWYGHSMHFILICIFLTEPGSSPPRAKNSRDANKTFVLDIAGPAPQPFTYCPLALRKPDSRRKSTQTWRFTDDGRLCCAHKNMCVQSKDGFMGLCEG